VQISLGDLVFDLATAGDPGAPLVLMLHGFPQTNYSWRHQLQPLADAGYLAVAPNQRGYSRGARPPSISEYATEKLIDDALEMIDTFGNGSAHVVGHDWGGQLSWLLAARHPQNVRTLTVLSRPHPQAFIRALADDRGQAERSKHHKAFQNLDSAQLLLEDDAKRLRKMFDGQGVTREHQDAYLQVLGEEAALDAAINWYRAPVQAGASQALSAREVPAIEVPTLYIWGDEDASVGAMAAMGTEEFVTAQYRFEILPGVGHFVTDEDDDAVTRLLLEHIEKHDGES